MDYKVVPFVAQITQKDTTATVAGQLQALQRTLLTRLGICSFGKC